MTVTKEQPHIQDAAGVLTHKPPMSTGNLFMMNVGFFGVQFSFALTQTAINPLFSAMGASGHDLPILNLAGPMTGLLIQPMIGALSDRTWSPRWGRRRPFILCGALLMILLCLVFPFISVLWVAVLGLWLLDAGNNSAMEPYRALISDRLPKNQLARGFLVQSMFTGAGAVLANVSIFAFQLIAPGLAPNGIPYWAYICFWLGALCILITVGLAMRRRIELEPTAEEMEEIRNAPRGVFAVVHDIANAVKVMPVAMHKIGLVFMFQFYAMFVYWQFVALSVGQSVFGVSPETDPVAYQQAVGWSGLLNGTYNLFTAISALFLLRFVVKFGGKWTHAACLVIGGLSMAWLANVDNQWISLIPMIGVGIMWASIVGVPYMMVASMVPGNRSGVYMGILNMMIVVPMLIETLTFGWIFQHLLGGDATKALLLSGGLMLIGAVAMLWVRAPSEAEESDIVPFGRPDRGTTTYDRVIVGSDGTENTLFGVRRAMEIAEDTNAKLTIVTVYRPEAWPASSDPDRVELIGKESGREALRRTVAELNSERLRTYDALVVPGDIAETLLAASDNSRRNLIVVGNRGLGAEEGSLGSVPTKVVQNAASDVMVIQTDDVSAKARQMWKRPRSST